MLVWWHNSFSFSFLILREGVQTFIDWVCDVLELKLRFLFFFEILNSVLLQFFCLYFCLLLIIKLKFTCIKQILALVCSTFHTRTALNTFGASWLHHQADFWNNIFVSFFLFFGFTKQFLRIYFIFFVKFT